MARIKHKPTQLLLLSGLLSASCLSTVWASPVRVVVGDALTRDAVAESKSETLGLCALWQALLTKHLSESESTDVVEREQLSDILREHQLSLAEPTSTLSVPALSGADFFVLNELADSNETCTIVSRLVSASTGSIELRFKAAVDANSIEKHVIDVAATIEKVAVAFSEANTTLLVAVADFENHSPLDRHDWMETSLPRRLRRALRPLPGVRLLEREQINLLLAESRLDAGGFTRDPRGTTKPVGSKQNTILITGAFDDYHSSTGQPQFECTLTLSDVDCRERTTFHMTFLLDDFDAGLGRIEARLIEELTKGRLGKAVATSVSSGDQKPHEAKVEFDQALRLMGYAGLGDLRKLGYSTLWGIRSYAYFNPSGHPSDGSAARHANILRAVRYLKTSVLLDNNDPYVKELLAVLLADRQVREMDLARELACEVAARYPGSEHERDALLFLFRLSCAFERRAYVERLMHDYGGSYAAQSAVRDFTRSLADREDMSLADRIAKAKELMPIALQWPSRPHFVAVQMQTWFRLTQQSETYKALGEQYVETMIERYARSAVAICTYWAYQWDYVAKDNSKTIYWCRRGLDLFRENPDYAQLFPFQRDYLRFMLGRNLYETQQYALAVEPLNECTQLAFRDRALFFKSVCLFHLGRYDDALAGFEPLGRFSIDGSATEWTEKTRHVLGTTAGTTWRRVEPMWIEPDPQLPRGYISALALDEQDVWIGVTHPATTQFGEGHNLVMLEKDPKALQVARTAGGLFRYRLRTKQLTRFEVGKDIPSAWITDIEVRHGRVFVGTYGAGLAIYNKDTGTWSCLSEQDGMPSDYVQCLDSDDTHLWIGTGRYGKGGVARMDLQTQELLTFLPRDFPESCPPPVCYVNDIKVIGGRVWCMLGRKGAAIYDIGKNVWTALRQGSPAYSLEALAVFNGRLWLGAREGNEALFNCDAEESGWRALRGRVTVPETSVFSIEATDRWLFLGTYGLMVMSTDGSVDAYGLRSGFTVTDILSLPGQVWLGTQAGIRILKFP